MINTDRIVPITAVDLISMYGLILKQTETELEAVASDTVEGDFVITETGKTLLANEPVKTVDFASGVTASTLYFVAGYDYVGFTVEGEAVEVEGEVLNDGKTLYQATLASGAVTVEKVGF